MSEESGAVEESTEEIEMFETTPSGDDYEQDQIEMMDDEWSDDEEEVQESETKSKNIDEKAIDKLEDKSDDDEEDDDQEEDDSEEKDEDGKEEDSEKEKDAPKHKTIKGKLGDESVDIAEDATIKVTVDGKAEYPTIKELRDNYSGQKKWTQEIETAKNEARTVRHEKEVMESDKNELMTHVSEIGKLMDGAVKGEVSPLSAMEYFLQLTGRNVYEYNKVMVDQLSPVIRALDEMSESEQEAYWYKLENEHLKSNRAAEMRRAEESKGLKEKDDKLSELRESQGVSQEQFILAQQELREISSEEDWTPEKVIEYVTVKPLYQKTYDVMKDYSDMINQDEFDGVQDDLVKFLREHPESTEETIREILIDALELEPIAKELEPKVENDGRKKAGKKRNNEMIKSDKIETFEDYY